VNAGRHFETSECIQSTYQDIIVIAGCAVLHCRATTGQADGQHKYGTPREHTAPPMWMLTGLYQCDDGRVQAKKHNVAAHTCSEWRRCHVAREEDMLKS
jgi:hypothetical protein